MRLFINVGKPHSKLLRDISTFANNLIEDLKCSYNVVRKVSGLQHRCSEGYYNERVVYKLYTFGAYVCVLYH